MRKHTNTTTLLGARYPISLVLRDFWYRHYEAIVILVVLLAIAVIGGIFRNLPVTTPQDLKPVLMIVTAQPPTATPTSYPTPTATVVPTAVPTEVSTEAPAPVVRAEPIQEAAPAWCESGCNGGVGPVEPQPIQESVPTPDPRTAPTSEVEVICPPAPCPDPPDPVFAATIQALPEYNAHPLPPVQPMNVDQAGRAGA